MLHYRYRCTAGAAESRPSYQPHDSDDGPSDIEMDDDDMHVYLDQDLDVPQTSTANLGPYARFLADLPDWGDLSQNDYTKAFEALLQKRILTFFKKGITIQPVYRNCIYIIPNIMPDVIADIIPYITYSLSRQSVVSIMTDL